MFLVGGPAYSGTTLLALMLNQPGVTCLSEPDFHDPSQSHNGIPVLAKRYPGASFPERVEQSLTISDAFELALRCQAVVRPDRLGMKFCNRVFLDYADEFIAAGFPVVAIVRDVRDVLVRPLLPYVGGESGLVDRYREIWRCRHDFNAVIRYEDLIREPVKTFESLSVALDQPLVLRDRWHPSEVHPAMLYPRYRHYLLESGRLDDSRIGIWRSAGKTYARPTHTLAEEMGYL